MSDLTPKQEAFVREYLIDLNATQAAIRAGYSEATAKEQGSRLLTNVHIADAVAKGQAKAAKRAEITVQSLAEELEEARTLAIKEAQSSAAVAATMGKAKLFGLGVENKRVSGSFQLITLTQEQIGKLSPNERSALAAALPVLEKLGAFAEDADDGGSA
ncbi:hypothetical protein J2S28_001639 [Rhizobium sp. SLBN-94]|nr:hypothetical protein [Rhizobium sp. SLBN-94]